MKVYIPNTPFVNVDCIMAAKILDMAWGCKISIKSVDKEWIASRESFTNDECVIGFDTAWDPRQHLFGTNGLDYSPVSEKIFEMVGRSVIRRFGLEMLTDAEVEEIFSIVEKQIQLTLKPDVQAFLNAGMPTNNTFYTGDKAQDAYRKKISEDFGIFLPTIVTNAISQFINLSDAEDSCDDCEEDRGGRQNIGRMLSMLGGRG